MKRHLIPLSRVLSFALFVTLIGAASAVAQNRATAGVWNGAISLPGTELVVSVSLQQKDDGTWSGTTDIPAQDAKGLPLSNIAIEAASISFSIAGIPGNPSFKGKLSEDAYTTSVSRIDGAFRKHELITLAREAGLTVREARPALEGYGWLVAVEASDSEG